MRRITSCRISGEKDLISVLDLGEQQLTGRFPSSESESVSEGPLELVWSPTSRLLQLSCTFDLDEMYGQSYGYRSGLNAAMVDHLTRKVRRLEEAYGVSSGDSVVDIGSNDATTLRAYTTAGLRRVGVDPTGSKFVEFYPADITLIPDFFPTPELSQVMGGARAKIVTSIAMFYDLDDPVSFAQSVSQILERDGVWHLEQSYMPSMLRMTSYDTICHEHLEYYTLGNIKYICDRADLRILDVEVNQVNGGSFAVNVCRRDSNLTGNAVLVDWFLEREDTLGLDTEAPFRAFEQRVFEHRRALRSLLDALNADGKKVLGYGASTKGNVVLQFCGMTSKDLACIAEVNPDKFGAYTPGTHIPIVSSVDAEAMKPDYYLVLPWHFREGILNREREFLATGGKMIFPFPNVEVVGG
jgi:hypothetical protein